MAHDRQKAVSHASLSYLAREVISATRREMLQLPRLRYVQTNVPSAFSLTPYERTHECDKDRDVMCFRYVHSVVTYVIVLFLFLKPKGCVMLQL